MLHAPKVPIHCFTQGLSRRQLLSVARGGLDDLGAGLTAGSVDDRDDISRLVIAHAPGARPLPPIGAIRIALDLPFAMEDGPGRGFVEGRTIRSPIDDALAGRPACGSRSGLQIGGLV